MASEIPENLLTLHEMEESVRSKSLEQIKNDEGLRFQLRALETSMTVFLHFATKRIASDQDNLAIQHLGLRLLESAAASLKLVLAGYYRAAAGQARDLLETGFLLDYLHEHPSQIEVWRKAESSRDRGPFEPRNVRSALDKRDGFVEKKREEHYRVLSRYATHPHPKGFLLHSANTAAPTDDELLKGLINESAMDALLAAEQFVKHFAMLTPEDLATRDGLREMTKQWSQRLEFPAGSN